MLPMKQKGASMVNHMQAFDEIRAVIGDRLSQKDADRDQHGQWRALDVRGEAEEERDQQRRSGLILTLRQMEMCFQFGKSGLLA